MQTLLRASHLLLASLFSIAIANAQAPGSYRVSSPDGGTEAVFTLANDQQLTYSLTVNHQPVITDAVLGLLLDKEEIGAHTSIVSATPSVMNETFAWPLGENDSVQNNYHQLVLACKSQSGTAFEVEARVFKGTLAFRYIMHPGEGTHTIPAERTLFHLPQTAILYQYNQESQFSPVSIDTFNTTCDFPATLSVGKGYLSINEADNHNYTKAVLQRGTTDHSLVVSFVKDKVQCSGEYTTPWRTISYATTAIGLHDYSDLLLRLCKPSYTTVPGWIRPGKLLRAQLNTRSGLDCIDFAVKNNYSYIMFDGGWYGKEFRSVSDPRVPVPELDLPEVIAYGKKNNIGVILYVNYVGLRQYLDTLLPLYKQWGVAGMKFGFVDGLKQEGITWLNGAIKKTMEAGFILDIHDNYKPTGLSRTYPNLLTQEGIGGDEHQYNAYHHLVLPYTRFLSGAADHTFCFPPPSSPNRAKGRLLQSSKGQQLALSVICFSPLQSMLWYGEPKDYTNEEEIEFYKLVPTVWNKSLYVKGEIGENIAVARKKDNIWYLGLAAGLKDWKDAIDLSFLDNNKKYEATIYSDDASGHIVKDVQRIKPGQAYRFSINASGGEAVVIREKK